MKQYQEHKCSTIPKQGVSIFCDVESSPRDKAVWQLFIQREATEEDLLENGLFEYVGETMWQTCIEISHCPYCGVCFYEKEYKLDDDHGLFSHFSGEY